MNNFEILDPPAPLRAKGVQREISENLLPHTERLLQLVKSEHTYHSRLTSYFDVLLFQHFGEESTLPINDVIVDLKKLISDFYSLDLPRLDPRDAIELEKSRGNNRFRWYGFFTTALLVGCLTEDRELLRFPADYAEAWFVPESMAIPVDPVMGYIYISVATAFRSKPLEGHADMEALIAKSRKRIPKLLLAAWDAARNGIQSQFEESLLASVQLFEKQLPEELISEDELIAFPHSTILAAARLLGMRLPDFEPRIMARLLTTESVGLRGLKG